MRHSQPLQFQKIDGNGINNIDLQSIDRQQSTSLCCTNQELRLPAYRVSQKNNDIGQAYFFSPLPLPPFLLRPRTYRKGYYFYSSQSPTVIKSKMVATTILRTRTRFRPPKIRLHCRLEQIILTSKFIIILINSCQDEKQEKTYLHVLLKISQRKKKLKKITIWVS